jgi:hypothetical protein
MGLSADYTVESLTAAALLMMAGVSIKQESC